MESYCFVCDKLIRNNDAELKKEKGLIPETRILSPDEMVFYLKKKVQEEAIEVAESETKEDALNELVDVYEASKALLKALGISDEEFQKCYTEKREKKGDYSQRVCLVTLEIPEGHEDLEHYLQRPEKYPQK